MPVERERDCPKCGAPTEVKDGGLTKHPERLCTNGACNWGVTISGG